MIVVRLNQPQFEYDIHSLVKAFYPAEDVKVFEKGTKDLESSAGMPECSVLFEDGSIMFSIWTKEEKCEVVSMSYPPKHTHKNILKYPAQNFKRTQFKE